jgi:Flp pilus assembly protein TadG
MRNALRTFRSDRSGSVAPTVGLSLFMLVAAGGVAFDYARMATLDTELQNAADLAALAAASQLDGEPTACARAVAVARNVPNDPNNLLQNRTLLSNDAVGTTTVNIADSAVCVSDTEIVDDATASVRFFEDKAATIPAIDNVTARFVEVRVNTRRANFALTPIVGALSSGDMSAKARAGLGTALCRVPPLMVCPPSAGLDWNTMRGYGVRAVSNTGPNWAPGAFGYIGPQDANSTQIAMAFENPVFQCQEIQSEQPVSTGGLTPAVVALNTRFDIYEMNAGGQALSPCLGSACPPALNVTKDLINVEPVNPSGANSCKIQNNGWRLPDSARRFRPREGNVADGPMTQIDADGVIDAMGLPRDNIHFCSYNAGGACNNSRFGNGVWARGDYFNKYHSARTPIEAATWTRYETYLWEIANGYIPKAVANGTLWQQGSPVCNPTLPDPNRDRRVVTVAVGSNCSELHGASTPVQIEKWVEMFLVEPGVPNPGRGNGDGGNEIYLEVIREVDPGGAAAQVVRRDTPFLVK